MTDRRAGPVSAPERAGDFRQQPARPGPFNVPQLCDRIDSSDPAFILI